MRLVPKEAIKLAYKLFTEDMSRSAFQRMAMDDQLALAEDAGLDADELAGVLSYIDDFNARRADALERWWKETRGESMA